MGGRIGEGDTVRIYNDRGEVHCEASVTPEVRPGTISIAKGLWTRSTFNGSTANALVPDTLTDIGGGACFNEQSHALSRFGPSRLSADPP